MFKISKQNLYIYDVNVYAGTHTAKALDHALTHHLTSEAGNREWVQDAVVVLNPNSKAEWYNNFTSFK